MSPDWPAAIEAAAARIEPIVRRTRVRQWPSANVWLKLESEQVTGSFKARGGSHKLIRLSTDARAAGVVTASSGNHGAGVAHAAQVLGCPLVVFVPHHADTEKLGKIRDLGAKVRVHGDDCVDTEAHARAWANENGQTYISPYNDSDVIAGQGTVAFELLSQVDKLDAVFVSVGGGGLISGIGAYLKARCPEVEIVACSPIQSPAMHACLEAGRIIEVPCGDTLSDATAGGVEPGAITFPLCQRVIDRSVLVDEAGIAAAMRRVHTELSLRIEGAAGVAVAAWEAEAAAYRDRRVGIIICGGNISDGAFKRLIGKDPPSTIESG